VTEHAVGTRDRAEQAAGERITWIGIAAEILLIAVKLTTGVLGRSQALVADGIHSASDLVTDLVTLVALRLGSQPGDREHPYGHGKIEDLAAFLVGIALVVVALLLAWTAIGDFRAGLVPERSLWLVAAAALSVIVKELLARATLRVGRRILSPTLVANAAHHRSDVYSSLSALAGLGLFYFYPRFHWADMAAAIFVALFIVHAGLRIAWQAARDLVDTAPGGERIEEIRGFVLAVTGVRSLRRLRGRSYAQRMALDLDIEVEPGITVKEGHDIAEALSLGVRRAFPEVYEVMVHVEPHEGE
jgi:cation diffusion facilitator family transporter